MMPIPSEGASPSWPAPCDIASQSCAAEPTGSQGPDPDMNICAADDGAGVGIASGSRAAEGDYDDEDDDESFSLQPEPLLPTRHRSEPSKKSALAMVPSLVPLTRQRSDPRVAGRYHSAKPSMQSGESGEMLLAPSMQSGESSEFLSGDLSECTSPPVPWKAKTLPAASLAAGPLEPDLAAQRLPPFGVTHRRPPPLPLATSSLDGASSSVATNEVEFDVRHAPPLPPPSQPAASEDRGVELHERRPWTPTKASAQGSRKAKVAPL